MGFSKWIAHDGDRTAQKFGWLHMVTESPAGFNHVRSTATTAAAISSNSSNKRNNRNKHFRESCVCQQVEQMSIAKKHGPKLNVLFFFIQYIWLCFFSGVQILVRVGSSSSANHTHESYPEPYPESYLRIIPPKITIMNVSFGIVWDCMASLVLMDVTSQLTSVGQIR